MIKLGVNIDHIATLRQARREFDPDPIMAARMCEEAGASSIVAHLREDRRHIQDRDVVMLRKAVKTRFNLEMSLSPGIVKIALDLQPDQVTLVPERRAELTTEGGLNVVGQRLKIKKAIDAMMKKGIDVSVFIAPEKKQIDAALGLGIKIIELHTGSYAHAFADRLAVYEFAQLKNMTTYARKQGMTVNSGHGLNYENTYAIAHLKGMTELNIGHSIISRAAFVGLKQAVREMLAVMR